MVVKLPPSDGRTKPSCPGCGLNHAVKIDIDRWFEETGKYAFGKPSSNLRHADKRGYLDMLGRHVGAYKEDNLQKGDSLVLNIEAARPVKR